MVTTPDFGGLPCVQVLKLHYCSSLEDIHPSLGHHASLVYLSVHHCHKLKMIPTVTGMKKLKTLEILDCDALHEFPEIHAIIDRHWSIFTADTIAEFSPGSSSWTSSYSLPAVYSQWWNHDVFLSLIGEYDSKAFVDHLYSTFIQQGIHVYKPDKTPSPGDSIGMSFKNAIEESQIVIIIFTTNYAGSSRCLDELTYIMRCIDMRGLNVMPIFYDVSSSDVQKQSGAFGKEFDKQELENMAKVESWRKALNGVCKHSGWSLKHIANRNESRYIKDIVATVSHRLFFLNSKVRKDFIGIGPRLESLTSELAIGPDDVRMVVVGGIGGSGKTTIASCVYMEISRQFEGCCFVENVRDESSKYGIKKLQQKLLSTILKKEVDVRSDEEGKHMIQSMLCHRKVLIVLDDVNDPRQLELLAGSHEWFGEGSRIIITSREGNVLLSKVDAIYDVSLLSNDEAIKLFRRHAYPEYNLVDEGKWRPSSSFVEAYDTLSQDVISFAYGLPLTLKVLGSFLYEKGKDEWEGTLAKLRDVSNPRIIDKLKISYDGLQPDEKELFLDIACFFKGAFVDSLRTLLNAFHFHPFKRVNVLVKRGLISITNGMFDMHDLIEEMAHHIVREGHPTHPQKHSRVWQWIDVANICATDTKEEFNKIQALYAPNYDAPSNLLKVVANMKHLQLLSVRQHVKEVVEEPLFLSNELRWISWENYPASSFPTSFQPELLFSLILRNGLQRVLWKSFKHLPRLKVLDLHGSKNLDTTPDFGGLPNLERLVLSGCSSLKEIDRSTGYHERLVYLNLDSCEKLETFPPVLWMPKLETLILSKCSSLLKFPEIKRTMNGLKYLYMDYSGIDVLPSTVGRYCINLVFINLIGCDKLERIEGNFQLFKQRCVILVNAHNMKN
ncbi:disease resistance protein Roq1-like [Bidens hawaiensis]|uniref:disease resistance protein Roq1-like n=1 Tax=Bidens hawaiensis TaxID=980011 RepID=UPI00404B3CFC